MKTISSYGCLNRYGFYYLTGEACAYGQRALFNITRRGMKNFCDAFGLLYDERFTVSKAKLIDSVDGRVCTPFAAPSGMNNPGDVAYDETREYVASVMIARSSIAQLAVTCLANSGCTEVIETNDGALVGIEGNNGNESERLMLKNLYREHVPSQFKYLLEAVRHIKKRAKAVDNKLIDTIESGEKVADVLDSVKVLIGEIEHLQTTIECQCNSNAFYVTNRGNRNEHVMSGRTE